MSLGRTHTIPSYIIWSAGIECKYFILSVTSSYICRLVKGLKGSFYQQPPVVVQEPLLRTWKWTYWLNMLWKDWKICRYHMYSIFYIADGKEIPACSGIQAENNFFRTYGTSWISTASEVYKYCNIYSLSRVQGGDWSIASTKCPADHQNVWRLRADLIINLCRRILALFDP